MRTSGTDRESLMAVLKEMSEVTKIDRMSGSRKLFQIHGMFVGGKLQWKLEADHKTYASAGIHIEKGNRFSELMDALDRLQRLNTIDERMLILLLAKTNPIKNYDGSVSTEWMVFDPFSMKLHENCSVEGTTAVLRYPVLSLNLTESEYKVCETRLALYDEFSDILYPVQRCAYEGLGKLMDCSVAFRYEERVPVAAALFLAERLADTKPIRFLYRERTKRVRPFLTVYGRNYVYYDQREFMETAFKILQEQVIWHIERWSISDEVTRVVVSIDTLHTMFQPQIEIRLSDTEGSSMSVTAFIKIEEGSIFLKQNRAYHSQNFQKKGGVSILFEGIFSSIQDFETAYRELEGMRVYFREKDIAEYLNTVGKKRSARIQIPPEGEHDSLELFHHILKETAFEMNDRWKKELTQCNHRFFRWLCKHSYKEKRCAG